MGKDYLVLFLIVWIFYSQEMLCIFFYIVCGCFVSDQPNRIISSMVFHTKFFEAIIAGKKIYNNKGPEGPTVVFAMSIPAMHNSILNESGHC